MASQTYVVCVYDEGAAAFPQLFGQPIIYMVVHKFKKVKFFKCNEPCWSLLLLFIMVLRHQSAVHSIWQHKGTERSQQLVVYIIRTCLRLRRGDSSMKHVTKARESLKHYISRRVSPLAVYNTSMMHNN